MKMVAYRKKSSHEASYELVFESKKEEEEFFKQSCEHILNNTRWYLDNLDSCMEYKVSWGDYHKTSKFRSKTA